MKPVLAHNLNPNLGKSLVPYASGIPDASGSALSAVVASYYGEVGSLQPATSIKK